MSKNDNLATVTCAPGSRELIVSRVFDAPREVVWKAWTDPKQIVRWWGPVGFQTIIHEMDFRVGGTWHLTMWGPDGKEYPNYSTFTEIVPLEKIVFSHGGGAKDMPEALFVMTWSFKSVGNKTELTVKQVYKTEADRDFIAKTYGALEGAKQTLGRLQTKLDLDANPDKERLLITRAFNAPRDLVFKAWTDPKHIMKWWGPKDFTAPFAEVDLRVGGIFRYCMRAPDGTEYWNKGMFREIVSAEKIVSVIYFSDKDGNIVDSSYYKFHEKIPSETWDVVTFRTLDGGRTELTLLRDTPLSVSKKQGEDQGWNQSLDRFEAALKSI
jgi:uncharacterized protein YndB with AHSA1/START domain